MVCPECGYTCYPRIMPAVIVGVIHGERMLVTQYNRKGAALSALIAGFTEIGETLEETVSREVMEETGLTVEPLRLSAVFERVTDGREGNINAHKMYFVFLCRYLPDVPPQEPVERDAYQTGMEWLTVEEAKNASLFPKVIRDNLSTLLTGNQTVYLGSERRGGQ